MSDGLLDDAGEGAGVVNEEESEPKLTIKEQLRAKRDELRRDKKLILIIPGYDDLLAVRYEAVPSAEMQHFAKKLGKTATGMLAAQDTIIKCCQSILVRDSEDAEWEDLLGEEGDDTNVRFDKRLAEFLGFEASSARDAVKGTFSPDDTRPLAAFEHAQAVMSWMQGKSGEIDPGLLGE